MFQRSAEIFGLFQVKRAKAPTPFAWVCRRSGALTGNAGTFPLPAALPQGMKIVETAMLRWAVIFLVLGLVAGALGFGGVAGTSIEIAKFLFYVLIAIFVVFLVLGLTVAKKVSG